MPEMPQRNAAADVLEQVNAIISQFIPLIGPILNLVGMFLRQPNVDPAMRRQLIANMRVNFTQLGTNVDTWLEANGFNQDGTPKVPPPTS